MTGLLMIVPTCLPTWYCSCGFVDDWFSPAVLPVIRRGRRMRWGQSRTYGIPGTPPSNLLTPRYDTLRPHPAFEMEILSELCIRSLFTDDVWSVLTSACCGQCGMTSTKRCSLPRVCGPTCD